VRPERVSLVPAGAPGALAGRIEDIVYVGSDTSFHVLLADGLRFRVRVQNRDGAAPRFAPGDPVGLAIPAAAVQVLER